LILVGGDGVVQAVEDEGRTDGFGEVVAVEVGAGVPGHASEGEDWPILEAKCELSASSEHATMVRSLGGVCSMALDSLKQGVKERVRACEDWWFDTTRHVQTSGLVGRPPASKIVGELRDSHIYGPVRVANAHGALRDLPLGGAQDGSAGGGDYSQYTFIDMGSGKGRVLFVAAEYPFRKVIGVEFSNALHEDALANLKRYKYSGRRCGDIEAVHADARDFEFPDDNLVIYLFNPFGPEVMERMLANLESSLERHPRHVIVAMLWPDHSDVVEGRKIMRVYRKTRRHHIFEAGARP
jgi:predicted RNA methylase